MEKTQQSTLEFRVKVVHGDYRKGRRHWFRVTVLPEDKIHARFEMETEEGDWETLEMDALVRFEQTTSGKFRVGDWMAHHLLLIRHQCQVQVGLLSTYREWNAHHEGYDLCVPQRISISVAK